MQRRFGRVGFAARLASLALVLAAGCASAQGNADEICAIAEEAGTRSFVGPAERSMWVSERIMALSLTSDTEAAFEAIASAVPEQRYELMQAAFEEQGVQWDCPAFEQLTTDAVGDE